MKRTLLCISLLSLAIPAHAGWLDSAKSMLAWLAQKPTSKTYMLGSIAASTAAVGLAVINHVEHKKMQTKVAAAKQKLEAAQRRYNALPKILALIHKGERIHNTITGELPSDVYNQLQESIRNYNCSLRQDDIRNQDVRPAKKKDLLEKIAKMNELENARKEYATLARKIQENPYKLCRNLCAYGAPICAGVSVCCYILGAIKSTRSVLRGFRSA